MTIYWGPFGDNPNSVDDWIIITSGSFFDPPYTWTAENITTSVPGAGDTVWSPGTAMFPLQGNFTWGSVFGRNGPVEIQNGTLTVTDTAYRCDALTGATIIATVAKEVNAYTGQVNATTAYAAYASSDLNGPGGTIQATTIYAGAFAYSGATITATDIIGKDVSDDPYLADIGSYGNNITVSNGSKITATNIYSTGIQGQGVHTAVGGTGAELVVSNYDTLSTAGLTSSLTISFGGKVTVNADIGIGRSTGDNSTIIISESGSQLSYQHQLKVGDAGTGTLRVYHGPSETLSGGLVLGAQTSGNGTLQLGKTGVDDSQTKLTVGTTLIIGDAGTGSATVANGATLAASSFVFIGDDQNSNGSLTVTGTGTAFTAASDVVIGEQGTGTFTLSAGATATMTGKLELGDMPNGNGTLTVKDAGTELTTKGVVIIGGESHVGQYGVGTATVQSGATWDASASGQITIGDAGTGSIVVKTGAAMSSGGNLTLGAQQTGDGSLTVTDAHSTWTASGGDITIGDAGTGNVIVSAGGTVSNTGDVTLGGHDTGDGSLTLTGANSTWTAKGGVITIGDAGTATVTVEAGGAISNDRDVTLGAHETGDGSLTVTGANSTWTANGGDITIGDAGAGSVTVEIGGAVTNEGNITLGAQATGIGSLTLTDDDTTWTTNGGDVTIGDLGQAIASVMEGATFAATGSDIAIADSGQSVGQLTISDATLDAKSLTVGGSGIGTLLVQSGGSLSLESDLTVGEQSQNWSPSADEATITDAGSSLTVGGNLTVGGGGAGVFAITTGSIANVHGGSITIGDEATGKGMLSVTAAVLNFAGDVDIGASGDGSMSVQLGGVFTPGGLIRPDHTTGAITIGKDAGSTGQLTVDGFGSTLESAELTVGSAGQGTLTITNSAVVQTTDSASIADLASGFIQNATVDTGAMWTITNDLSIGPTGALTVSHNAIANVGQSLTMTMGSALSVDIDGSLEVGGVNNGVANSIVIDAGHSFSGSGVVQADVVNQGRVVSQDGVLDLEGNAEGPGTFQIGANSTLELHTADVTVTFVSSNAVLKLDDAGAFTGSVAGFTSGDKIDLAGVNDASSVALGAGNMLVISGSAAGPITIQLDPLQSFADKSFILIPHDGSGSYVQFSADAIFGTPGDDILGGGVGAQTMIGGAGNDSYFIDNANDTVIEHANEGLDTVFASVDYTMPANVENLVMQGSADLQAHGNDSANSIFGNTGNNVIDGGAGADVMAGGAGNDTYYVDNAGDAVMENANQGTDTVMTSISCTLAPNVENLVMQGSADLQGYGNADANSITGNSGNNLIDGGAGADIMKGRAGNDVYFVDDAGDSVVENANEGNDSVFTTANFTLGANVENLIMQGSADLQGYGNADNNVLYGNSGNNLLNGNGGADLMVGGDGNDIYFADNPGDSAFEMANQGNDTVFASCDYGLATNVENLILLGTGDFQEYGSSDNNVIYGNSGNNLINGGAGVDLAVGGAGNDTYFVDDPSDACFELANEGSDAVFAACNYGLAANVETLVMQGSRDFQGYGSNDANTLYGNSGNNLLNGAGGADTMIGGAGNDTYFVDNTGDVVFENANEGTDAVFASVNCTLTANVEALVLQGGANLSGTGNGLANSLFGNVGDNTLDGAGGADNLTGGAGNDTFVFHAGEANGDTVVDFAGNGASAGDSLQFVGFGTAAGGATFTQIGATNQWQIHSGLDAHNETITLSNDATVHASDVLFS